MLYTHSFEGVVARSGDILFTRDGTPGSLFGALWGLLGHILPGDLDHAALFIGPGVRFVESAARGVVLFEMEGTEWNAEPYGDQRLLLDQLVGVGDPLAGRGLAPAGEAAIRESVVEYCLAQVAQQKPYNLDFFNPDTDGAFYCSQLIYKAYLRFGIDLHVHLGGEAESPLAPIVLPQDLWNACLVKQRLPQEQAPRDP